MVCGHMAAVIDDPGRRHQVHRVTAVIYIHVADKAAGSTLSYLHVCAALVS